MTSILGNCLMNVPDGLPTGWIDRAEPMKTVEELHREFDGAEGRDQELELGSSRFVPGQRRCRSSAYGSLAGGHEQARVLARLAHLARRRGGPLAHVVSDQATDEDRD